MRVIWEKSGVAEIFTGPGGPGTEKTEWNVRAFTITVNSGYLVHALITLGGKEPCT